MTSRPALQSVVSGLTFQNPIVLASGTAGYGAELDRVIDLDALGGFVTKAVSVEPRAGAPAPRVAEFEGGMINAVGLANPGLDAVRREHLPWLASHLPRDAQDRQRRRVRGRRLSDGGRGARSRRSPTATRRRSTRTS